MFNLIKFQFFPINIEFEVNKNKNKSELGKSLNGENKSSKKIILSHSRVHEDEKKAAEAPVKTADSASASKKAVKKTKTSAEKTTLGDITQLAALKEEMEEKENQASKK